MKLIFAHLTAGFAGILFLMSQCAMRPELFPRRAASPADTCIVHLSPYYWNTYVAATFYHNGKPLQPAKPFVARLTDTLDWFKESRDPQPVLNTEQHEGDFRFGHVYITFKKGSIYTPFSYEDVYVECVSGQDTMHVVLVASVLRNTFYDSIPFKPGYHKVYNKLRAHRLGYGPEPRVTKMENAGRVFAPYFEKHRRQLAKNNPFANCVFKTYQGLPGPYSVLHGPKSPADIIEYMLTQTDFYREPIGKIVPTAKWVRQKKIIPERK